MQTKGLFVVILSLFAATLLQIMPLHPIFEPWRPDWLLLALCYWSMALPHRFGLIIAWVFGLILDVLIGTTIGINALGFAFIIYVVHLHYQRIRNFAMAQQAVMFAFLSIVYHVIVYFLSYVTDNAQLNTQLLYPWMTNAILWTWIFWLLRNLRRHFKIR